MSEMVERIADALRFSQAPALTDIAAWSDLAIDSRGRAVQAHYRQAARASIEAMRAPTAAMLFVGSNDEAGFTAANLLASWELMIDEALK